MMPQFALPDVCASIVGRWPPALSDLHPRPVQEGRARRQLGAYADAGFAAAGRHER